MAGAARQHPWVLVGGLLLSITLTGLAASWIAKLLHRFRWIGFSAGSRIAHLEHAGGILVQEQLGGVVVEPKTLKACEAVLRGPRGIVRAE